MGCLGTLLQYTYAVKYRRGGTAGLESPAKDTSPKARKTHYTVRISLVLLVIVKLVSVTPSIDRMLDS